MRDIERIENKLLAGQLTVSELSDSMCKKILRRWATRHRNALRQLEGQLRAQELSMPKLEVVPCTKTTKKELSDSGN